MKKFFALALALVLTFAMAVTCFAAHDIVSASGTKAQDVVIKYVAGDTAPETYAVDIAFESMEFTYNAADKYWDAENHVEVSNETGGAWVGATSAKITVTNHSNVAIQSAVSYAKAVDNGTVVVTLTGGDAITLAAAAGTTVAKQEATLAVTGTPALTAASTTIGTVTVTISAAPQ